MVNLNAYKRSNTIFCFLRLHQCILLLIQLLNEFLIFINIAVFCFFLQGFLSIKLILSFLFHLYHCILLVSRSKHIFPRVFCIDCWLNRKQRFRNRIMRIFSRALSILSRFRLNSRRNKDIHIVGLFLFFLGLQFIRLFVSIPLTLLVISSSEIFNISRNLNQFRVKTTEIHLKLLHVLTH